MTSPVTAFDGLPPLRDVIARHDLKAKKAFGQNFILDLNLTCRIARLGSVADQVVIEVGPGPGGLTRALLHEGARKVIAVERDERCRALLAEVGARYPGRLDVHFADALTIDWMDMLHRLHVGGPVRIVANLPYGIATPLLTGWLESADWPPFWSRMTLMFQREVADRIVAPPGTKAYGRLAVLSQWRSRPHTALQLPPEAFTPPPKVSSTVVTFEPVAVPSPACDVRHLSRVTAAAFGQRRKMLRQSLKSLDASPEELLARAQIDGRRRAETLSVEEFATLANAYAASAGQAA